MKVMIIDSLNNKYIYSNVWEIQDNLDEYIVIKYHNHECHKLPKALIKEFGVNL